MLTLLCSIDLRKPNKLIVMASNKIILQVVSTKSTSSKQIGRSEYLCMWRTFRRQGWLGDFSLDRKTDWVSPNMLTSDWLAGLSLSLSLENIIATQCHNTTPSLSPTSISNISPQLVSGNLELAVIREFLESNVTILVFSFLLRNFCADQVTQHILIW